MCQTYSLRMRDDVVQGSKHAPKYMGPWHFISIKVRPSQPSGQQLSTKTITPLKQLILLSVFLPSFNVNYESHFLASAQIKWLKLQTVLPKTV